MSTENRQLVVLTTHGFDHERPSVAMAALHLRRALDLFANGIWCTALVSFAIGPPIFVALSAIEIVHWWSFADRAL